MDNQQEKKAPALFGELTFPLFGVKKDDFKLSEVERLERGVKSDVHDFRLKNEQGQLENKPARISIYRTPEGKTSIKIFDRSPSFTLKDDLSGVPFTPAEKETLEKGNALLKRDLPARDGGTYNAWIQVDRELNRLEMVPEKRFHLSPSLLGQDMTRANERLRTTGEVRMEGLSSKSGGTFDSTLKVNILKGSFDFVDSVRQEQKKAQGARMASDPSQVRQQAAIQPPPIAKKKGRSVH